MFEERITGVMVIAILLGACLILGGCSCRTIKEATADIKKHDRSFDTLIVDHDGNKYPVKTLLDGKLWMTANLSTNLPNSYCYQNTDANCSRYGRLYTLESAKQGCSLLGEGWRLPTYEEGRRLTSLYGRGSADSSTTRKEAYKVLMQNGSSGFNAVLGGNRDPDSNYARGDAHGFYWTSNEDGKNTFSYFNFAKGSQSFFMQKEGEKARAFSVRCVRSKQL